MSPDWHALFAPLPEGAVVTRKPVAASLPSWESLTVEMSAGPAGLRHVMVTHDGGKPISAGDWVMFRSQTAEGTTYVHENVGGRLEPDGRFNGTRWRSVTFERADGDEAAHCAEIRESHYTAPTPQDVEAIQALVLDVLRLAT